MRRIACLLLGLFASSGSQADPVEDFYAKKTITIVVGMPPPDQHDNDARLLAKYMGKYVPGNPSFIVQNMPGAGGMKTVQFMASNAARDGTTFAISQRGMMMMPLLRYPDSNFDPTKFTWIGTRAGETSIVVLWHTVPVTTIQDAMKRETIVASSGGGADSNTMPFLYNETLGTKFKVVVGYAGGGDMNLAMERGEVEARINSWSSWKVTKPEWVQSGAFVVIAQGARRNPELGEIPSVIDLAREGDDREVVRMITLGAALGRPVTAPPGVPEERVAALREAFVAMTKDPGLLVEASAMRMEIEPLRGQDMQQMISQVLATPARVAARAKEFLE